MSPIHNVEAMRAHAAVVPLSQCKICQAPSQRRQLPRWRFLAKAVAHTIAVFVREASSHIRPVDAFSAGAGGGDEVDVKVALRGYLEALALSEEDTAHVLLAAFALLQRHSECVSSSTWRSLLVMAILAAVRQFLADQPNVRMAAERLHRAVLHWWPRSRVEEAYALFTRSTALDRIQRREICYLEHDAKSLRRRLRQGGHSIHEDSEFMTPSLVVEDSCEIEISLPSVLEDDSEEIFSI